MTPTQPPEPTASARSTPGLALAHAKRPGRNSRQQPSRREQMLNTAAYAAQQLEAAADGTADPRNLRLAAEALRASALRLITPKPPRQTSRRLPQAGDGKRPTQQATLEQLLHAAAAARAIASTAHLTNHDQRPPSE